MAKAGLNNDDALCSVMPFLGIYQKKIIRNVDKDLCTKMFITALFITGKKRKKKEVS